MGLSMGTATSLLQGDNVVIVLTHSHILVLLVLVAGCGLWFLRSDSMNTQGSSLDWGHPGGQEPLHFSQRIGLYQRGSDSRICGNIESLKENLC